jgi:alpha/beta superfamily hydrolase
MAPSPPQPPSRLIRKTWPQGGSLEPTIGADMVSESPAPLGRGVWGEGGSVTEHITFLSGSLLLEGRLSYGAEGTPDTAVLLLAPHPHFAGNLDNNVLTALAAALTTAERAVLRFNYRGVDGSASGLPPGASPYAFWQRVEEEKDYAPIVDDAAAALAWLRRAVPSARRCHLVGYSFGAILAALLAEREEDVDGVAVVAPPLRRYPEPFTRSMTRCPGSARLPRWTGKTRAFFLAEEDFLYGPDEIAALGEGERFSLTGADHFFRGHEDALSRRVAAFLTRVEKEAEP